MSTIKQIAANRLNALLSTGPRSVEGKAISTMNALRSGIDAKSDLIRGEDSAALETLTAEYRDRFLPANPEERLLVDILIHDDWLLRRFRRVDAEIFECEMQDAWTPKNDCPAGQAFSRATDAFSRLQRRIDATERSYHRSLQSLRFLQQNPDPSPAPDPQPPAPDVTPMPTMPQPEIGFVPQPSLAPASPPGNLLKEHQGSRRACLPAEGARTGAALCSQFGAQRRRKQQPAQAVAQFSEAPGIDQQCRIASDFWQR